MVAIRLAAVAAPLLALLATGCSVARETEGGTGPCTACHGDATRASGQAAPSDTPHDLHLAGGATCESCHVVPSDTMDPGHLDTGRAEVTFGGAATENGASPTYDPDAQTCTNTYCHGGSVTFTPSVTAEWSATAAGCASCHAYPPASHDVGATDCSGCHPGTVLADDATLVSGGGHLDGATGGGHPTGFASGATHGPEAIAFLAGQIGASQCTSCHGSDFAGGDVRVSCNGCHASSAGVADWQANCTFCHGTRAEPYTVSANPDPVLAAPPEGVAGAADATDPSVGAHAAHLNGETVSDGVACADCHAVPQDLGHLDGDPVVVTRRPGTATAVGSFDGTACSNTWCHGNFPNGRAGNAPSWTATSGQDGCGTCHFPQLGGSATGAHSDHEPTQCNGCHDDGRPDCGTCHPVSPDMHVNGTVDVHTDPFVGYDGAQGCNPGCHAADNDHPGSGTETW